MKNQFRLIFISQQFVRRTRIVYYTNVKARACYTLSNSFDVFFLYFSDYDKDGDHVKCRWAKALKNECTPPNCGRAHQMFTIKVSWILYDFYRFMFLILRRERSLVCCL